MFAAFPEPIIGRRGSAERYDEMNPIWLGTMTATVRNSHDAQRGRVTIPRGRRHGRSSGSSPRSTGVFTQRILRPVVRKLSLHRDVAKSTSLRCPRCSRPGLASKKAHLIAFECRRCRGVWLGQEDFSELTTRASRNPTIPCLSRVQSWEDVFSSALCCSPHRGTVEASTPCGDNGSQENILLPFSRRRMLGERHRRCRQLRGS